jgi:hypothetical protein
MDLAHINHAEVHVLCCLTEQFGFRHPGSGADGNRLSMVIASACEPRIVIPISALDQGN